MNGEAPPEPDRIEGAPHPRETRRLIGQGAARAAFLEAYKSGRLHHAWLLTGPRGVGKATLAWEIARFLLATPEGEEGGLFEDTPPVPSSLEIDPDHPVARRIMAGSEPGLKLIRRTPNPNTGRLRDVISVDDIRQLTPFLSLSAAEGGWRVVIVDAADEMNPQASNALLKMLEEPPAKTTMLLVSHQPSRLLPTIRSRCRVLRLTPLAPTDMAEALAQVGIVPEPGQEEALAALSGGSVGEAVRLINLGGLEIYAELVGLFGDLPRMDRSRALKLAEAAATRGAEAKLDLLIALIELFLARLARSGAAGHNDPREGAPGEAALFARLAPDARASQVWAELAEALGQRMRHGRAVNLDPAALILDTLLKIRDCAAG
ncbi:DNA polymerase III subunit delta' [Marimonas arenosa]|uniref:DNA polymerase III subunit delta n=1 Tax=Marimonas arenosa TaxID=1795305 RepID=A0AAE3WBW4_9RHOB|nr:DNA polymerase III subunit delta' [Marimonas arenosa]MDQ2090101.1 DNA polymerase III subunit delta' [Marimonas arenosa]